MDAVSIFSLEKFGIKFGLANIRTLALALGQPQNRFRSILIAGTNGKGSVTAMVDRALRAAGLSVARYTSPHLVNLEERFAINGEPVSTTALVAVIEEVRAVIETLLAKGELEAPPTFFEVTTAIAFELFGRAGVDIAVLEVGLGGRLDSTNIVDPVAAAITSIDFDHEQYLGNTLAAIAAEKAGVIRRGIPVVAGPLQPEARDVLVSACASIGADFIEADIGVRIESTVDEWPHVTAYHNAGPRLRMGAARTSRRSSGAKCSRRRSPARGDRTDRPTHCRRDSRWPSRRAMAGSPADARGSGRTPGAARRRAQSSRRVRAGRIFAT